MNSALQCLSHCEELSKYFLLKIYAEEINKTNKLGTRGEVARAYFELLRELWQGKSSYLCPSDFRQIFVRFVRQFAGFSQHDSHEMLTFMLDTLHEDLNRIKDKPYVQMEERKNYESDSEASKRWWNNHILRENSIIVDLFHGQYKSVITCPECNHISITYDAFMYLGLPIPSIHIKISYKYFPYETEYNYNYYDMEMPINENSTVKEMKTRIAINNLPIENLEAVRLTKDKSFKEVLDDGELIYNSFNSGEEIVIYEKYPKTLKNPESTVQIFLVPAEFLQSKQFFFINNNTQKVIYYPIIVSLDKKASVKELYINVFKYLRKILPDKDRSHIFSKFRENVNNKEYVESEFNMYFNTRTIDDGPFTLHFINNISEYAGFFASKPTCEYCGGKCQFCKLSNKFTLKDPVNNILTAQVSPRPVVMYVQLNNYIQKASLHDKLDFQSSLNKKNLITKQSEVDIYDCINLFRTEERLERDNMWYCSNCKKHQEAYKKLDIYRPPNVLIVQFKRFKIKSNHVVMGMISNKKNDSLINYPVESFDLRSYVVGDQKDEAIYDLFGISQHYGSLSSGHYTALCRNGDQWYEFDDQNLSRASSSDIVSSSAYMLFYKKRQFTKK